MARWTSLLLIVLVTGCASHVVVSPGAMRVTPPASKPAEGAIAIERLSWLSGTWIREQDSPRGLVVSEEHWMSPRGGSMLGANRTVVGERTAFYEFLRIAPDESGVLVYHASPRGRSPATAFTLVECGEHSVEFANPEHDFPQRIRYCLEEGVLHARISGQADGEERAQTWSWRRAPGN